MSRRGVGARIAWSIQSKITKRALAEIFGGNPFELLSFEEGEARRATYLAGYADARSKNSIKSERFEMAEPFTKAVGQTLLACGSPDELVDIVMQDSERKGVYRSTRAAVAECANRLLDFDRESILVGTLDGLHGVLLDVEGVHPMPIVKTLERW